MMTLRAAERRREERVKMVRNLLEQHVEMSRAQCMKLTELEWVLFKLGCSIQEGEKLVAMAKRQVAGCKHEGQRGRYCSQCGVGPIRG